jgi:hypothetical protein
MFQKKLKQIVNNEFNNVFIVDNRNSWVNCIQLFNAKTDIVFCLDFGLKNELDKKEVNVFYLDHIVEPKILQDANYQMHHFLDNWFKDDLGKDLLVYRGLKIGDALLLNLITDVTLFCHFFFNVIAFNKLKYKKLFLAIEDKLILDVFDKIKLKYQIVNRDVTDTKIPDYTFPISFWVNTKLYKKSLTQKLAVLLKSVLSYGHYLVDLIKKKKYNLYIQDYHPTKKIISNFLNTKNIAIRTSDYCIQSNILKQRRIPKKFSIKKKNDEENMLKTFISSKKQNWYYEEYNLSEFLYEIITPIITDKLREACNTADIIIKHFQKVNYSLIVPVTNYWLENRLIMNHAINKNIPIFMIANGLLNMSFERDGRDSDYVNCYSETVKEDYFNNSKKTICLGDPRMDKYFLTQKKQINREIPTIIIGAAGFNPIDLNSYLAYEFDFLYDILIVLKKLTKNGLKNKTILKVRDNGYAHQYQSFVKEYFSELDVQIIKEMSFSTLITQADLYISIYSQTLIEASCLEIPVIYYKKDNQFINRPFDGNSELVTAKNIDELREKIKLFYDQSDIFNAFMEKSTLEKYIGPLDGKNTERNIEFIMKIITQKQN